MSFHRYDTASLQVFGYTGSVEVLPVCSAGDLKPSPQGNEKDIASPLTFTVRTNQGNQLGHGLKDDPVLVRQGEDSYSVEPYGKFGYLGPRPFSVFLPVGRAVAHAPRKGRSGRL